MRVYLSTTKNQGTVPYDHIPFLVGAIHKWLGPNNLHEDISLYSFSWLRGAREVSGGLQFPKGAVWFISSYDTAMIKKLIAGIQSDPAISFGLRIKDIMIREDPSFGEVASFTVASPVFIKRKFDDTIKHFIYKDKEADGYLTETLQTKLRKAGLDTGGVQVAFNKDYHAPRTKLVRYNGIGNKASICPVTLTGKPAQIAFAWNVGIGNSTGIGFGALN